MSSLLRQQFLLGGPVPGPDAPGLDTVRSAIESRYRVVHGPRQRHLRVWLDTFDCGLRSAGLSLAHVAEGESRRSARPGELVLAHADGQAPTRQRVTARWPTTLDGLPDGPVLGWLRRPVGIRALLPLATVRATAEEWRILDDLDKTVVRLQVDQPACVDAEDRALPARVCVLPVRGYDKDAARVARLIAATAGVVSDPPSEVELIASTGVTVLGLQPRPSAVIRPGQDAVQAVASLLLALLEEGERNVRGTIEDVDTEFLHDLRVSVRRTRSALRLVGDVLPDGLARRFGPEFKWLGDLTTPMRDLDVFLLDFDTLAASLTACPPTDLEPFRVHLRKQRTAQRRKLLTGLRSARFAEITSEWRAALEPLAKDGSPAGGGRGEPSDTAALATRRIKRAWRRVANRHATITGDSPAETIHDLRKRCKELRYVLELFSGICANKPYRAIVGDLKRLQDSLGRFQDAEVHRDSLRSHAAAMMTANTASAPAILAMGELAARFDDRQREAASDALGRMDGLVTEANWERISTLVRSA